MELRIPMQPPTVRPWPWPGWDARGDLLDRYQRRRFRLTLHDLAELRGMQEATRGLNIDWSHLPNHEIAVYVPKNLRHLIRFDSSNPGFSTGLTYKAGSWPPSPVPTKRPGANSFNIFSFNHDFSMPDLKQLRLEPPAGAEMPRARGRHWEDTARAWAGAALVVLAFVLFIRAMEKCIHAKFFKPRSRRRASSEWETPTVFATSYQNASDQAPVDAAPPHIQDSELFSSESPESHGVNDLPPPYSECANAGDNDANKYIGSEEPPPPYSACYVAYSNPKDGLPSVHFLNRRREDIFQNRSQSEAGQSSSAPDVSVQVPENAAKSESGCDDSKTELVFENGRVIQREEGVNSEGMNARSEEFVVDINEPGSSNVPDRSLQV